MQEKLKKDLKAALLSTIHLKRSIELFRANTFETQVSKAELRRIHSIEQSVACLNPLPKAATPSPGVASRITFTPRPRLSFHRVRRSSMITDTLTELNKQLRASKAGNSHAFLAKQRRGRPLLGGAYSLRRNSRSWPRRSLLG